MDDKSDIEMDVVEMMLDLHNLIEDNKMVEFVVEKVVRKVVNKVFDKVKMFDYKAQADKVKM